MVVACPLSSPGIATFAPPDFASLLESEMTKGRDKPLVFGNRMAHGRGAWQRGRAPELRLKMQLFEPSRKARSALPPEAEKEKGRLKAGLS